MDRNIRFDGPQASALTVALAHGAGAPMDSPFMDMFADGLAARGLRVARFEFPYMRRRRTEGGRRPPDRAPVLLDAYRQAIAALGGGARLVVGGKSMGGRIASMLADEVGAQGLVCLGYPFHPPGRDASPQRIAHLATLRTPALIVQGTRDSFGTPAEVADYALSGAIRLFWAEDGDHDFKPRKSSGRSREQNRAEALDAVAAFVADLD